jgi:hypothetical protein
MWLRDPEALVQEAYRTLFNRNPEASGSAHYTRCLRDGWSNVQFIGHLSGSPEGLSHGLRPLSVILAAEPNFAEFEEFGGSAFIEMLYFVIVKSKPDPTAVVRWCAFLNGGFLTKRQIFNSFLQTLEARRR